MIHLKAIEAPIFQTIAQAAEIKQFPCYVIGGYVRDYFLNRDQKKDIDIVAVGSGIELAEQVSALLPKKPKFKFLKRMEQRCSDILISNSNLSVLEKNLI
jgi:poly(A) polymerase